MPEKFELADTVEVIVPCAWTGDVGVIRKIRGGSIYVKFVGTGNIVSFGAEELKHSQQKLNFDGR